jgi:hypothetical protein
MSGQKTWDKMNQAEKIEELHGALINLQRAHDNLAAMASRTETSVREVARAAEDIRKRLDQAKIPPT